MNRYPPPCAMDALVLAELPLPNLALSSNDRGQAYRYERSALVRQEYDAAYQIMLPLVEGIAPFTVPVAVTFTLRLARGHRRDPDNLSGACKPWLDALCRGRGRYNGLGLLVDDGPRRVVQVAYRVVLDAPEPGMEIRIAPWADGV